MKLAIYGPTGQMVSPGHFIRQIPLQNKYSALLDPDEPDADMIDSLNHWAHKVQRKPSKIAKKLIQKKMNVVIKTEEDLDAALAKDSELARRLPGDADRHRVSAMMAKAPPPGELQDGEIWGASGFRVRNRRGKP